MCSNFGFNHHPGRPPAALESSWYSFLVRLLARLRRRLQKQAALPLQADDSAKDKEADEFCIHR